MVINVPFLLKNSFVRSLKYIFRPFVTVYIGVFAMQGFFDHEVINRVAVSHSVSSIGSSCTE